jgi:hypothetical protein
MTIHETPVKQVSHHAGYRSESGIPVTLPYLHIKPEFHDVTLLHDVGFAFGAHFAGGFC